MRSHRIFGAGWRDDYGYKMNAQLATVWENVTGKVALHIQQQKEEVIMAALNEWLGTDSWPIDLPKRLTRGMYETGREVYFLDGRDILHMDPARVERDGDLIKYVVPHSILKTE